MKLEGEEFLRRFLLHVLPKGLMRIRHYGFLANRCRRTKLTQIRSALAQQEPQTACVDTDDDGPSAFDSYPCPKFLIGRLVVTGLLALLRFGNTTPLEPHLDISIPSDSNRG
jgi:hypothetical protein